MPEPRGRSFAELDLLFERGVSARKFASTRVDVFDQTVEGHMIDEYERRVSAAVTGEKIGGAQEVEQGGYGKQLDPRTGEIFGTI